MYYANPKSTKLLYSESFPNILYTEIKITILSNLFPDQYSAEFISEQSNINNNISTDMMNKSNVLSLQKRICIF